MSKYISIYILKNECFHQPFYFLISLRGLDALDAIFTITPRPLASWSLACVHCKSEGQCQGQKGQEQRQSLCKKLGGTTTWSQSCASSLLFVLNASISKKVDR